MIVTQKSQTVAWLTTLTNQSIQDETVNTVSLYKSKTDIDEQVDQHLQVRVKDNERLQKSWKYETQFNEKYSE